MNMLVRSIAVIFILSIFLVGGSFIFSRLSPRTQLAAIVSLGSGLIPDERLVDWTPGVRVGVIGGIPTRTTISGDANANGITDSLETIDNTGTTNVLAEIQAAVDAASTGEVVKLPPGTFRIDGLLYLGRSIGSAFNGKTLRGSGVDVTIIDQHSGGIVAGSLSGTAPPTILPLRVVGGLSKDSTTVSLSGGDNPSIPTENLAVGQIIYFGVENDDSLPVVSVYDFDVFGNVAPTNQAVKVISKTNNTVTFFPPLLDDYGAGSLEVRVQSSCTFYGTGIGIEDLTIDAANVAGGAYSTIQMGCTSDSWIKNVKTLHAKNYPIILSTSINAEIRHSIIAGSANIGTNGAGLLFGCHSCLIEDNIIYDAFPNFEMNGGSAGNVISYNYGPPTGMWDTNHAPHNQYNLMEGNALGFQMSDGYFGGDAYLTIFRNYFHGPYGVNLRRFNRYTSIIGNFLPNTFVPNLSGLPNIGNGFFDGTAQLSAGDPWRDYKMTGTITSRADDDHAEITLNSGHLYHASAFGTQIIALTWGPDNDQRTGASVGAVTGNVAEIIRMNALVMPQVGTVVKIGPGSYYNIDDVTGGEIGSFQEKDLDVGATVVQKGNRDLSNNSFESLGGAALPDSLFRTSKPSFFGSLTFPPYDPVTPRTPSIEDIPAGYRYNHPGEEAPGIVESTDFTVYVSKSGSGTVTSNTGGINCGSICYTSVAAGTSVVLTATPTSNSTFTGWSGGGCSGTGTCTVTVGSLITATFTSSDGGDSTAPTSSITPPSTGGSSSSGSSRSSSSGGGGGSSRRSTITTTPKPVTCLPGHLFSKTTGEKCTAFSSSLTTGGSSVTFIRDLTVGSEGPDVTALQSILISLNLLTLPSGIQPGYFGNLTTDAVRKYQLSKGISPATGYVGPLTRSVLNGGTATQSLSVPTHSLTTTPYTPPQANSISDSTGLGWLHSGSTGSAVTKLQTILKNKGFYVNVNGTFDAVTDAALKKFQCDKLKLCSGTPDTTGYGATGPKTRGELVK